VILQIFNVENLRKDAINLDSSKHNSDFMRPFITKKNYPFKKKNLDNMIKKQALFLIGFFQKILTNSNTPKEIPRKGDKFYLFPTFNLKMKVVTLPTGYCTNCLPKFVSGCDYESCEIDGSNDDNCILICGHEYHYECLQSLQFKCQHCLHYLLEGVEYLGSLYNDRLENLGNTPILILNEEGEEEEENTIDDENIDLDRAEELILSDNSNLDQSLRNALHSFKGRWNHVINQ